MIRKVQLAEIIPKHQFGRRLDQALANLFFNYSRSRIKQWILNSNVQVNGKIVNTPKNKILGGEVVTINAKIIEPISLEAQNIPLNIIYEDSELMIINKPCNLVMHPGIGNINNTILNGLLYYYPDIINVPRAGIVHRLDKNTTGLAIIAKTPSIQTQLIKKIKMRNVIREYEAIVIGSMVSGGTINASISRHLKKRTYMTVNVTGKSSITHYRIIKRFHDYTYLRIRLETGRTHQIRVHMSHIHHPIVGDPLYGGRPRLPKNMSESNIKKLRNFNRQALHASTLYFNHPRHNTPMEFHSNLPQDMLDLLSILKIHDKNL
ncbi:Ribosomal large subunit pseudouridine synthase D [Candidatus Ecksteinia adelgidicola]|nr:Ribosomal large subunit pseudouridine synthase D [Candidatus Ecksteinia adelgidicola]